MQARYDAGRDVEEAVVGSRVLLRRCVAEAALSLGHGLVRQSEGYDRQLPRLEGAGQRQAEFALRRLRRCPASDDLVRLRLRARRLPRLPALGRAAPERGTDAVRAARLAALGRRFPGWAAFWVHDLVTGRTAGWNSDAQFPAASTVKLGVLLAALARSRHPERSPLDYDLRQMTRWSSNLAANRLLVRLGGPAAVEAALRRAGARRSTYPQGYRVGTALRLDVQRQPPLVSGRVTTAHDLGRILYLLHAGALGNEGALRIDGLDRARSRYGLALLVASETRGNNEGLLRPWLPAGTPIAQKNGWLHDARHTAAIVYFRPGPKIVVVLTYLPNLRYAAASDLGRRVLAAVR
jgi:beta-lactamase class A